MGSRALEFLSGISDELSRRHPGKYLAIVNGEVVAVSGRQLEAYRRAKEVRPDGRITLVYVPTKEETVTLL